MRGEGADKQAETENGWKGCRQVRERQGVVSIDFPPNGTEYDNNALNK